MEELLIDDMIELEGFITYYKFENESNGYRIALFKIDDNKQERTITIVGYFHRFNKTDALVVKGKMIRHKKFGLQLEVSEIYKKLPTGKEHIVRYLSSSQFKGIGAKKAMAIYEYIGDNCLDVLINDKSIYDKLLKDGIIKQKHVDALITGLKNFNFSSNAYQILLKNGFSLKNIMKAEATYGDDLDTIIALNPYQMILDIDGIGFKSIDKIALSMGISEDDPRRVKAAILYSLLNYCHNSGNTYASLSNINNILLKLIKIDNETFLSYINELIDEKLIISNNDKYYHHSLFYAEQNIANKLKVFIERKLNVSSLNINFEKMIEIVQEDEGIIYSNEQIKAIYEACSNGLYIITGGPGTGKTTILNAILKMLKMLYGDEANIALCAPTGRASKRMSILSKCYASTIHRLLKWDLHSNSFAYNSNNKLKCDVIIIDEFSMVDTLLFEALLNGTTGVSQIILIGDDGQIPSVGAGNLLYDLLHFEYIKSITLSHIYRQTDGSSIVDLSYNIRYSLLDEKFPFNNDVTFLKLKNTQASSAIVMTLEKLFEKGYTFDDIQIIIPMYANVAGIDNINAAIQQWYNPKNELTNEVKVNHQVFREGDRVLQLKNQPEDDIYNGDIGVVIDIDLENEELTVLFDVGEVVYPKSMFSNLTLAYAISIHKSQGSEFDIVIMCVFSDYGFMLNKQLIYTGITRAKKSLMIMGDFFTFMKKSLTENINVRKTSLNDRLNEVFE